ncbi:MAG TPA: hypothetical protein PK624_10075 [Spirochaetota bacterium]|nr:hypothetical protein [Spirochaetota bacterium]HOR45129.1 hypothetical protein [Spirochaetota bacterium]HOU84174.1 hypothetical protein [Spirochaetota bacterium]HPK56755.1 hypothetical protein [Spirochaetota bacterium]HQE59318.1 hypothetical protein [Spirochaetota bacterium]
MKYNVFHYIIMSKLKILALLLCIGYSEIHGVEDEIHFAIADNCFFG